MNEDCKHDNFKVEAKIGRVVHQDNPDTDLGYACEISIFCLDCFQPFVFEGMETGASMTYPMRSADGMKARLPIKPL